MHAEAYWSSPPPATTNDLQFRDHAPPLGNPGHGLRWGRRAPGYRKPQLFGWQARPARAGGAYHQPRPRWAANDPERNKLQTSGPRGGTAGCPSRSLTPLELACSVAAARLGQGASDTLPLFVADPTTDP